MTNEDDLKKIIIFANTKSMILKAIFIISEYPEAEFLETKNSNGEALAPPPTCELVRASVEILHGMCKLNYRGTVVKIANGCFSRSEKLPLARLGKRHLLPNLFLVTLSVWIVRNCHRLIFTSSECVVLEWSMCVK